MESTAHDERAESTQGSQQRLFFSKRQLRRAAFSLSVANLCFLFIWTELLAFANSSDVMYYERVPPDIGLVWALLADIFALGVVIFICTLASGIGNSLFKWTGRAVVLFFTCFALYEMQRSVNGSVPGWLAGRSLTVIKALVIGFVLYLFIRSANRARRLIVNVVIILLPLLPVLALNAIFMYNSSTVRQLNPGRPAGMLPSGANHRRAVWIIFDEVDYRLAFAARPARIRLPEMERMRTESLFADHVRSPNTSTLYAIPSLLLGRTISYDVKPRISNLLVKLEGTRNWIDFASQPQIFHRARTAGLNTAVAGWHHPYCRLIGQDLSDCAWATRGPNSLAAEEYLRRQGFFVKTWHLVKWQAHAVPFLVQPLHWIDPEPNESFVHAQQNIAATRLVADNAKRMLLNSNLNLVFLHIPAPHPPGFWDIGKQQFATQDSDYIDNLQLADKILGEIRRLLEQTGDWNRSLILVSSDHPLQWGFRWSGMTPEMQQASRFGWQPYIPFFLKMPGQTEGLIYSKEFNSVLSADLIMQALEGVLNTPEQVTEWLDEHRAASLAKPNAHLPGDQRQPGK